MRRIRFSRQKNLQALPADVKSALAQLRARNEMTAFTQRFGYPEKQLLASCARTELSSATAQAIRELSADALDWNYVLAQAEEHSIVSLLERNLRAVSSQVPPPHAAKLTELAPENAVRSLALSAELIRVVDALESRGISAIPYKGPVTAAQAYRDITARQFEDLDLLVRQRDIVPADETIRALGYAAKFHVAGASQTSKQNIPGQYQYFSADRKSILELHTESTLRHFPVPPDLQEFFARAVTVDLGGRSVKTLCPEDAIVALCVHGAKDFWAKLIWIADIAEVVRSHPELSWQLVRSSAEELRAQRMVNLGLILAKEMLDANVPPEIWRDVESDSAAARIAEEIARSILGRDTRPRTARQRFGFRRRMVAGAAAGWRYAVRLTLAPAEEDWQDTRLPDRLAPLYIALRPLRLLRKYGWSR